MAFLKFLKGNYSSLNNAAISEGQILVTKDTREIFVDVDASTRIKIGDFITVANMAALPEATAVPTSRLYYVEDGNILARSNGTTWVQVNRQKTKDEMIEFLGLGSMSYKSEVAEGDLNTDLAAKINAASGAQHTHANADVLNGISAEKVAAWDAAEGNAKSHADGLNTAMNTRVEALEAVDHEHANKALLDTYTQTEANLADAVAKKHAHTFNETELNKIVEGDVAKWNGVAADHLTSADKTTLENAIKEAKKAGTDANTALETYKVANDARVLAVEEDIAEIVDGTNGVLAQAKAYSDGKLATARTEITAEIDADVKVVADELAGYKTSNDAALAGVKATAEAAAVKTEVETALSGKVDKVEGKDLIATSEIERLATLHNYDDTQVKADIAKKADAETMTTELGKKVDKVEGKDLIATSEIERLATLKNYDDTALAGRVTTAEGKITALETESAKHALKTELEAVDAKFADYKTAEAQKAIDDEQDRRLGVIEGDYLKAADIANFETKDNVKKVADDLAAYVEANDAAVADRYTKEEADGKFALIADAYDDEEVRGLISDNADAIAAEVERASGIEAGLDARIKAVEDDYLKAADKTALQEQITANANAISAITNGIDAEKIDGLNDLIEWADEHASEVKSIKEDIEANAKAISDHEALAAETYETKTDATSKKTEIDGRLDALEGKVDVEKVSTAISSAVAVETGRATQAEEALSGRIKDIEDNKAGYATTGEVATAKQEAITAAANDAASKYEQIGVAKGLVDALADGQVAANTAAIATKAEAADVYTKTEIDAMFTWGEF